MEKKYSKLFRVSFLIIIVVAISILQPSKDANAVATLQSSMAVIHVPGDVANLQDAINTVPDGGVILLANGTYPAPSGGFRIPIATGRRFTIRAEEGATVTLDGGGTSDILRFQTFDVSTAGAVTFEDLTFANGYSETEGVAGGLTLYEANVTFIDCKFQSNIGNTNTTVGGGVYVAENSTVFFYKATFLDNISRIGGAGLGVRSDSRVYIHQSEFINNITKHLIVLFDLCF